MSKIVPVILENQLTVKSSEVSQLNLKIPKIKNTCINYICSFTVIFTLIVSILLIFGFVLIFGILFYYYYIILENQTHLTKLSGGDSVVDSINEYLSNGPRAVNFFDNVIKNVGQNENDYLLKKSIENLNVNLISENREVSRTMASFLNSNNVSFIRYAETTLEAIVTELGKYGMFFYSFNSDGSIYFNTEDNILNVNASDYKMQVPPGYYFVNQRSWFNKAITDRKSSWEVYFSGEVTQTVSFTSPVYFTNGTAKGVVNACFRNTLTTSLLKTLKSNNLEIILFEYDGSIISSTLNVNISRAIPPSYQRYGKISLLDEEYPTFINEIYKTFQSNTANSSFDKELEVSIGKYYVSYFKAGVMESEPWIVAILLEKMSVDKMMYEYIGVFTGVMIGYITIAIILVAIIVSCFVTTFFKGLSKNIKHLNNFELSKYQEIKIFPFELNQFVNGFNIYRNIIQKLTKHAPIPVIESLMTGNKIEPRIADITIMFIDIKDFTKNSCFMNPNEINRYLSKFYKYLDGIAKKLNTKETSISLDKYIGDCAMYWMKGVHSRQLAIDFYVSMKKILKKRKYEFRIGASFGETWIGAIGNDRLQFTELGTPVNIASRLETANKNYGTEIMFDKSVQKGLTNKENIYFLGIDEIRGHDNPLALFSYNYPANKAITTDELKFRNREYEIMKQLKNAYFLNNRNKEQKHVYMETFFQQIKEKADVYTRYFTL